MPSRRASAKPTGVGPAATSKGVPKVPRAMVGVEHMVGEENVPFPGAPKAFNEQAFVICMEGYGPVPFRAVRKKIAGMGSALPMGPPAQRPSIYNTGDVDIVLFLSIPDT